MIIGLTGKKGCGKSSVAKILRDRMGYEVLSFATPIKEMLKAIGFTDHQLNDPVEKEKQISELGKSARQCMQLLGTEFGRCMVKDNIWVLALEKRMKTEPLKNFVIDDVRFGNEAAMIHANGGRVVRVVRAGQEIDDTHISESGLDSEHIDVELQNTSCFVTDLEFSTINTLEDILYYGAVFDPESKRISSQ